MIKKQAFHYYLLLICFSISMTRKLQIYQSREDFADQELICSQKKRWVVKVNS